MKNVEHKNRVYTENIKIIESIFDNIPCWTFMLTSRKLLIIFLNNFGFYSETNHHFLWVLEKFMVVLFIWEQKIERMLKTIKIFHITYIISIKTMVKAVHFMLIQEHCSSIFHFFKYQNKQSMQIFKDLAHFFVSWNFLNSSCQRILDSI